MTWPAGPQTTRYLAVDLGDKRTGLAVGESGLGVVTPIEVIEIPAARREDLLAAIARAALAHKPDALVIGIPLNMDGTSGPAAVKAREFGSALAAALSLPVHEQDERLTSADADWAMAGSGLTHKKKKARRDALAAAAILRDYLSRTEPNEDPE